LQRLRLEANRALDAIDANQGAVTSLVMIPIRSCGSGCHSDSRVKSDLSRVPVGSRWPVQPSFKGVLQKRLESATKSTERSSFQKSTVFATPLRNPFKSQFGVFEKPYGNRQGQAVREAIRAIMAGQEEFEAAKYANMLAYRRKGRCLG
jgi:hypothetical protein